MFWVTFVCVLQLTSVRKSLVIPLLDCKERILHRTKGSGISGGVVISYDMLTRSVHRLKAEEPEIYVWVAQIKVILKENQDTDELFPI